MPSEDRILKYVLKEPQENVVRHELVRDQVMITKLVRDKVITYILED